MNRQPPNCTQAALEATQGQIDGIFSQLPYKCHLEEVASVGDWLKMCPGLDSRVVHQGAIGRCAPLLHVPAMQGYLAHQKTSTPLGPP